jgi:hypothetical protein
MPIGLSQPPYNEPQSIHRLEVPSLRNVRIVFFVLACYGIVTAFPLLLVGLFVGPHILAAAAGHFVIGVLGLVVGWGLTHGATWARIAGILMSSVVAGICLASAAAMIRESAEIAALATPAAFGLLFLSLLVQMIRVEVSLRRCHLSELGDVTGGPRNPVDE